MRISFAVNVDFMGQVSHFLGHNFQWRQYQHEDQTHLTVHISQHAYIDNIINAANLSGASKTTSTPYRSGYHVDAVPDPPPKSTPIPSLQRKLRELVGSLNWISQGSRPDLSTVTSMLSQYQINPHQGHIDAAKYAIIYLNQTKHLGIIFDSSHNNKLHSFTHYPTDPLHALTDANWGP